VVGRLNLDFAVDHGMPEDEPVLEGPPISLPVPDAPEPATLTIPTPTVVPVTTIITSGPTTGIAPIADIVQTAPLTDPDAGAKPSPSAVPTPKPPARPVGPSGQRPTRHAGDARMARRKPEPAKGNGKVVAILAGAVVVGGAVAAFYLLR
jgi:hypothetical protein